MLEDKQWVNLGGVDTSPTYLISQTLLPLFWTLFCMIWMELTRLTLVSAELPWCYFCAEIKVLGMTWKSTEIIFEINKKYWRKNQPKGAHTLAKRVGACPLSRGPPGSPPTSTPTPYIHVRGEKNQREGFIMFYDTEAPPSPKLSWEGWSGVRLQLRRGESVAIVIINNHPPSLISWCSPPCVSNSIAGLLESDGLDEIYHVMKLVLLGFDP